MSEDELRAKLADALVEGVPFMGLPLRYRAVDTLMPVITDALAEAWDDGYRSCCIEPGWTEDNNPWREQS